MAWIYPRKKTLEALPNRFIEKTSLQKGDAHRQ
jgi:hypothetical protein